MGKLLGDAAVWDDTPVRPRPLARGLVRLVDGRPTRPDPDRAAGPVA